MRVARLFRLLLLALPVSIGLAAGASRAPAAPLDAAVIAFRAWAAVAPTVETFAASGAALDPGAGTPDVVADTIGAPPRPAIGAPRQSLPIPVHNEATCGFCQAAVFPPLAPHPADISVTASAAVREVRVAAGDRLPHLVSHRPASSRAPPSLRIG